MSHKYVYLFSEGDGSMRELLGGKGANLAEMTKLGMPVPQGFTVTTRHAPVTMKTEGNSSGNTGPDLSTLPRLKSTAKVQ